MYTVLFPSGKTLSFYTKTLAETYICAYCGTLISSPTTDLIIRQETML